MEKKKVKIDEQVTCEILAERLRKMAQELENGWLEVKSGNETISLLTPESMPIEIEAKQKENKEKLVFEISWRDLTVPAEAANPPAEPEAATGTPPADTAPEESSPQAPEPTGETMPNDHAEPPAAMETNSVLEEEGGGENGTLAAALAAEGESAEPSVTPKPRAGRSRRRS